MKNKRIGRLNGKVVLRDPPYGDKNPRVNEIINTVNQFVEAEKNNGFNLRLYPVVVREQYIKDGVIMAKLGNGMTVPSSELFIKNSNAGNGVGYIMICQNNTSGDVSVKINPSGVYDYTKGDIYVTGLMLCDRDYPGMEEIVRREYPGMLEKLREIL